MQPGSLSDCWRNKRNARALSLPLFHESGFFHLSLQSSYGSAMKSAINVRQRGEVAAMLVVRQAEPLIYAATQTIPDIDWR
jgi:hypothetical protein